jgi:ABC-type antimicrobial peptide transport system permease subunit
MLSLELLPTLDGLPLPIQYIEGVRYVMLSNRLYPLKEFVATLQHYPTPDTLPTLALAASPTAERDQDIYKRVTYDGQSMAKAGAVHGLSRQRVKQIIDQLRATAVAHHLTNTL